MTWDMLFRLIFAVLVFLILGIRGVGHLKAGTLRDPRRSYAEGWITRASRPLPILIFIASLVYIVAPQYMAWSTVELPIWLRALSIPLGVAVILGMVWVHQSLSKYFSGKLEIRDDHQLVQTGPYRWVRHPMYTAVIALFVAIFLLTANWFIGLGGLFMVAAVIIACTPREEAMLIETFGEAYHEYMRQTPRYLPRLF